MAKRAADGDIGLQDNLYIPDDVLLLQDILVGLGLLNDVVPGMVWGLHETCLCATHACVGDCSADDAATSKACSGVNRFDTRCRLDEDVNC